MLSNHNVYCYGDPVGSGTYTGGDAVGVAAGYGDSCVLTLGGSVSCFGNNSQGQSNACTNCRAITLSAGALHTCILQDDGKTYCWGWPPEWWHLLDEYWMGDTLTGDEESPITNLASLSTSKRHLCVLTCGGDVRCAGDTFYEGHDAQLQCQGQP